MTCEFVKALIPLDIHIHSPFCLQLHVHVCLSTADVVWLSQSTLLVALSHTVYFPAS